MSLSRSTLRSTCRPPWWYSNYPLQANEIIPRLYIADMYTATDAPTFERLRITHVVSVITEWDINDYPSGVKHLNIPIDDGFSSDNLARYFDHTVEWIKNAMDEDENANVVVHCMCGISRSPSVVVAYLMATQGMSLSDSLSHVKAKRRISDPHVAFRNQLADYGEQLKGRAAATGV